jgi:hypothetical protein
VAHGPKQREKSYKCVCLASSLLPPQTLMQLETIYIPDITANGREMVGLLLALLNS